MNKFSIIDRFHIRFQFKCLKCVLSPSESFNFSVEKIGRLIHGKFPAFLKEKYVFPKVLKQELKALLDPEFSNNSIFRNIWMIKS